MKDNQFQKFEDFIKLFNEQKENGNFIVNEIPFSKFGEWVFVYNKSYLQHVSGKFFKIEGLRVKTNFGPIREWDQPIINQPEIGILGIITKVFNDTRYYLMQAKMEPGNVNILQLSPTVQATKSNFSQVHKGKLPVYLEYFIDRKKSEIIIDQLQSEQGGRFLKKRNRNMIVEVKEDIDALDNFFWLTLEEIKELLKINNFVNMDARSVISTIPLIPPSKIPFCYKTYCNKKEILSWFIDQKVKYELETEKISLAEMKNWSIGDNYISHNNSDRFFSIIGVKVKAKTREVISWTQPMIKDLNIGLIGFIIKKIDGVYHFLVQTKVMPGNIDIIDLSPTISCSNYILTKPPFIDYFNDDKKSKIHYDTTQSEEGGRFYHLQNRNMIVEVDENEILGIPEDYMWISYYQIAHFMKYSMFNIESRSLIAAINFI